MRRLLRAGADKVSLNTAALERPVVIREAVERFGSQCIVVAIDARREPSPSGVPDRWGVYTHGGRRPAGRDALEWAREAVALGAGEILLTSMDRDGTKDGYDLELTRAVSEAVSVMRSMIRCLKSWVVAILRRWIGAPAAAPHENVIGGLWAANRTRIFADSG